MFCGSRFLFLRKIDDHIFAGRLVIYQNHMMTTFFEFVGQFYMRCILIENRRMIKYINDFFFHNFFKSEKSITIPNFTFEVSVIGWPITVTDNL